MALRDSKSDLAASAQVLPNTDFLGRTSEDRQPIRIIVDLAALIRPIVAVNTQGIAFESQSKAERLNRTVLHFLPNQMMHEEGVKPVFVVIVASDYSLAIDVLKVAFNAYAAYIESELELPLTKANMLKLLTDQELQSRRWRKRVHSLAYTDLWVRSNDS